MITSLRNPRVAEAVKLRKRALRDKRRQFLVEGAQAVAEGVAARPSPLRQLFVGPDSAVHPAVAAARHGGIPVDGVSDEVIRALTSTVTPQGLVGVADMVDVPLADVADPLTLAVVLFSVRDPGNAGTILRAADAAGAGVVVFSEASVDVYNAKTVRSSAGSVFHIPVVRDAGVAESIETLRRLGLAVYGAGTAGERTLYDLDLRPPSAFVFGNEARGLPDDVASLTDGVVRIPIPGAAESLNLATAAGVFLFEAVRQRTDRGGSDALDDLVAGAAHDIRSPLTAVKGFVATLSRRWAQVDDAQRQAMFDAIAYDVERMSGVVRELVDASRLSAGRLELSPQPLALGDLVRGVLGDAAANLDFPPVEWEGEELRVTADPQRLRDAVAAMIQAAGWFGRRGPVRVHAALEGGAVRIDVARSGTELDPADAEHLFTVRRPGEGGGAKLGLRVARGVAEAQGGSLAVDVSEGFSLRLVLPAGS